MVPKMGPPGGPKNGSAKVVGNENKRVVTITVPKMRPPDGPIFRTGNVHKSLSIGSLKFGSIPSILIRDTLLFLSSGGT